MNLALLLAASAATILIAEGFLHVFRDAHGIAKIRYARLPSIWGPGDGLPWVLEPGAVGRHTDGYGEFDCEFSINSAGLRGDEIEPEKPAGHTRTLLLGDSVTVGWGVEQGETFAARLQELLNDDGPSLSDEPNAPRTQSGTSSAEGDAEAAVHDVLNCGWAAWNTTDGAYVFLRHRAEELQPDLVVLCYFLNDAAELNPSWWRPEGAALPETLRPDPGPSDARSRRLSLFDRGRIFLGQRSYLYNLVRERLAGKVRQLSRGSDLFTLERALNGEYPASAVMLFTEEYAPQVEERLALTERLFVAMDELCAERDARFAVAIIPADFQVLEWKRERSGILPVVFHDQPYVTGKAQRVISGMCERNGIPVLDLLPAFLERGADAHFFAWDPHPTASGHALIAEELAAFIEREGLLGTVVSESRSAGRNAR